MTSTFRTHCLEGQIHTLQVLMQRGQLEELYSLGTLQPQRDANVRSAIPDPDVSKNCGIPSEYVY